MLTRAATVRCGDETPMPTGWGEGQRQYIGQEREQRLDSRRGLRKSAGMTSRSCSAARPAARGFRRSRMRQAATRPSRSARRRTRPLL